MLSVREIETDGQALATPPKVEMAAKTLAASNEKTGRSATIVKYWCRYR